MTTYITFQPVHFLKELPWVLFIYEAHNMSRNTKILNRPHDNITIQFLVIKLWACINCIGQNISHEWVVKIQFKKSLGKILSKQKKIRVSKAQNWSHRTEILQQITQEVDGIAARWAEKYNSHEKHFIGHNSFNSVSTGKVNVTLWGRDTFNCLEQISCGRITGFRVNKIQEQGSSSRALFTLLTITEWFCFLL